MSAHKQVMSCLLLSGGIQLFWVICVVCFVSIAEPGCCWKDLMLCSAGTWLEPLCCSNGNYDVSFYCRLEMRDCTIVHPGAVCVMVRLLPKLYKEGYAQVSLNISKCHLKSVVSSTSL